jgi:hypothetical protein
MSELDTLIGSEIRVATRRLLAKERPTTLFEAQFFDLRQKAKEMKRAMEKQVVEGLKAKLAADMESKGVKVVRLEFSLGSYRGSGYIASFPMDLTGVKDPEAVATYLRGTYSPKWKLKGVVDGVASYNVR